MKITAEPRSDQWNADDFVGGPRVFTIAAVKPGIAEQKYDIELVEGQGRVWRPPLTVLRFLIAAWGDEAKTWEGRRVTLYRDDSVRFGSDLVGGIRVSHLSDLPGGEPFSAKITIARGRRATYTVQPLTEEPALRTDEQSRRLAALMREVGLTDRDEALALFAGWVGREIQSTKALTVTEASTVIDRLTGMAQTPAENSPAERPAGVDADGVVQADTGDPYDGPMFPPAGGES